MSAASTDCGEEDRLDSVLVDELRDRVDARLWQRRGETLVVGDVDRRRAVLPGLCGDAGDARPDDDAGDVSPPSCAAFESTRERALLKLVVVVLEEDEDAHSSRFSARNSRICSAALPSSSIVRVSPRGGGSESASTSVREPCSPARCSVEAEVGEREPAPAASSSRP